ncbi:MAG: hypothetical protein QM785_13330 [Pyrinomonadaceae bacterium]
MTSFRFCSLILLAAAFSATALAQTPDNCTGNRIFTAAPCLGDTVSTDERSLFDLINRYRSENGRPALKFSPTLTMVGNRRMLDLNQNMHATTHSWSNCPYDINDEKTWPCQTDSPRRLNSGYLGEGYETLYRTTDAKVDIAAALGAWKKSSLHNSIILNQGMFESMPWEEMGVAISGSYASVWFGYSRSGANKTMSPAGGDAYNQAVTNIFKDLGIDQRSATTEANGLRGATSDKKLKVEIWGDKRNLAETNIAITATTSPNGSIYPIRKAGISKILRELFPEWTDVDVWLDSSTTLIAQNRSAWRTKTIRGFIVDVKASGIDGVILSIKPATKKAAIEM